MIPILTKWKAFISKSCFLQKRFHSKSCFLEKNLHSKSCFLEKFFFQNRAFLKLHVIRKNCAFYGLNWIKMWFFVCNNFYKVCFLKLIFSSKSWFIDSSFLQNHAFKKYIFLENWHVVKFLLQNLTRCRKADSKSDRMKSFYFKIILFRKKFKFKIMLFRKIFSSKSCFLKLHVIRKKCAFYVLNWIKMWYFVCNIFFKICLLKLIFSSKSCFLDSSYLQNHAF